MKIQDVSLTGLADGENDGKYFVVLVLLPLLSFHSACVPRRVIPTMRAVGFDIGPGGATR